MTIEFLDHTADIAVRISGGSWSEFFQEAVRSLYWIYLGESRLETVARRQTVPIALEAADGETLLVDLLNELIYLFDSQQWLLPELEVKKISMEGAPCGLQGILHGESYDPARHSLQTEIKSATFHDLEIRRSAGKIAADVVFDL